MSKKYMKYLYSSGSQTKGLDDDIQMFSAAGISVVGISTRYGLDGPGIESRWRARFSAPVQTGPGAPPSVLYNEYRVFPGGKAAGAWC